MKLYAISDLHLAHETNREALKTLLPHLDDWVILAGDIGETEAHLHLALTTFTVKFKQVIWIPGNHDLWTVPQSVETLRGVAKYNQLVSICRDYGVLTPEDPYPTWTGQSQTFTLAPLFLLYDYSFRPDSVSLDAAVDWAEETNVVCTDEYLLHPDPYPSRIAWCHARCDYTEKRLQQVSAETPLILINHFPLREDLVRLKYIPRFSLWCGTQRTEHWHIRYPVHAVVYGHLNKPRTDWRNSVRLEEVSFG
ncbi:MAG: metallophosphoesterase [Chloroflexota bacterium]